NKVTNAYLQGIPERESIRKRITELWNYEKYSTPILPTPIKVAGKYYFTKNDGLQNQSVLYEQDTLDSPPCALIDPNTWSKDGTIALADLSFDDNGKYLAYGVAEAGSDWTTWKVLRLADQKVLDDETRWVKYSGVTWTKDGKGFFYGRFAEPKAGETFQ